MPATSFPQSILPVCARCVRLLTITDIFSSRHGGTPGGGFFRDSFQECKAMRNLSVGIAVVCVIFAGCFGSSTKEAVTVGEGPVVEPVVEIKTPAETAAKPEIEPIPLTHLDLSKLFNVNALKSFDEYGNAYPKDLQQALQPRKEASSEAPLTSLLFKPAKVSDTENNAVAADGQVVEVTPDKYTALLLLSAATNGAKTASIGLVYGEVKAKAELKVSDWCAAAPLRGEQQVQVFDRVGEYEAAKCKLFAQTVKLDTSRELTAIVLPENHDIKIFAATLTGSRSK